MKENNERVSPTFEAAYLIANNLTNILNKLSYYRFAPRRYNEEIIISLTKEMEFGQLYPRYHMELSIPVQSPESDFLLKSFHMDTSLHMGKQDKRKISEINEIKWIKIKLGEKDKSPVQTRLLLLLDRELQLKHYAIIKKRNPTFARREGNKKKLAAYRKLTATKFNWRQVIYNTD